MVDLDKVREVGAIPVSIATSLAIEGLGGFGEYKDKDSSINKYEELWINLRTLVRNLHGSFSKSDRVDLLPGNLIPLLINDILIIENTLDDLSGSKMSVKVYIPKYTQSGFTKKFPNATMKTPKTEIQLIDKQLEDKTIEAFTTYLSKHPNAKVFNADLLNIDYDIPRSSKKVCLLTHHAADLINNRFTTYDLLESHTGNLKPKSEFYTKLTNGRKLVGIPFNKFTLQIFGDGGNLFTPQKPSLKSSVINLAKEKNWTPATTYEKIKFDVSRMQDKEMKELLIPFL